VKEHLKKARLAAAAAGDSGGGGDGGGGDSSDTSPASPDDSAVDSPTVDTPRSDLPWTLHRGIDVLDRAEVQNGAVLTHHQMVKALRDAWPHISSVHIKATIKKYEAELPDGVATATDTGGVGDWFSENWVTLALVGATFYIATEVL
jgi:hypothetical protein